jgi:hypothetical protein
VKCSYAAWLVLPKVTSLALHITPDEQGAETGRHPSAHPDVPTRKEPPP